jgi:hypothetical protein
MFITEAARLAAAGSYGRAPPASVVEKQLAILERALAATAPAAAAAAASSSHPPPSNPLSSATSSLDPSAASQEHLSLLRWYMSLAARVAGDPADVARTWLRLLRRYPGEPSLWSDYISALRSGAGLAAYQYSAVAEAALQAVEDLAWERERVRRRVPGAEGARRAEQVERHLVGTYTTCPLL